MRSLYRNPIAFLRPFFLCLFVCLTAKLAAQSPYAEPETLSPAVEVDSNHPRHPSYRMFKFQHAKAPDALKILQQLTGTYSTNIAVDERTNSIIYICDEEDAQELELLFKGIDTETSTTEGKANGLSINAPANGPKPLAIDFSIGISHDDSTETLQERYEELEQQTHQLADEIKQSKSPSEAQRTQMQLAVRKSFEARQALQRAELADLARRMQSMQQSIEMRDNLADKVVQRRVEDLLDSNLKWESGRINQQLLSDTPTSASNQATLLPQSTDPSIPSVYVPGEQIATPIMKRIQGRWIVQTYSTGNKDSLGESAGQMMVEIEDSLMRITANNQEMTGPILLIEGIELVTNIREDGPLPIDFVFDPNGERNTVLGIIACDGTTLSICMSKFDQNTSKDFRPSLFIPGSKVALIKCQRESATATSSPKLKDVDLSNPQATLDTLHRYSIDHPDEFPAACYTDEALQELSGAMLQQLCFMSGISQIGLQTGGVIEAKNDVPIMSGTAPSFHLRVDALLKEHSLPMPPDECEKAFELLCKRTLSAATSEEESLIKPDRQLIRLAAGILKSPKDFLSQAGKLMNELNESSSDSDSQKKAPKEQPKYDIVIKGDEATATAIIDSSTTSITMNLKLHRLNERWLVSQVFSDEILDQIISSMSQVLGSVSPETEEQINPSTTSDLKAPVSSEVAPKKQPPEWIDFLKLLPESGTALVMFSYEPDFKEQMLPVARKVTDAVEANLVVLPLVEWRSIISTEATHFLLMKDRQLVGTRTGLITENRLQDFVSKAKDWLTPQSTGVDEKSLVRIDCYINPGADNTGSQHGKALQVTAAVIAVHEDQAILFGPESIANYIEKGYACVAVVRDTSGKQKQLPLDVVLKGPVKLIGRDGKEPKSPVSVGITFGDGTSSSIPLPILNNVYPKSFTEPLDAHDVGTAIYHVRGIEGLRTVKLAPINESPKLNDRVLSCSFTDKPYALPIRGLRSSIHWQSQTVSAVGGHIYGDNINGAELFEVLCPTRPAPCGFTFNEHGRLIGKYGLGSPSEKDMTHTVFKPDATHSILHAAIEKIDDANLKAALTQVLEANQ